MKENIEIYSAIALYKKEVRRFLKVYNQTIIAPIITSLIYLFIFNLAVGNNTHKINNVEFNQFIASGIIIMASMQNSFANTSSVLIMSKMTGTIIDYIIPPFSSKGITLALSVSGVTRGVIVGISVYVVLNLFVNLKIHNIFHVFFYLISSSMILSLLGILTSILSNTYEQMSSISTYFITPLSFLSGTFFSINDLPNWVNYINYYNPFFYIVDGFRYGLTNQHEGCLIRGMSLIILVLLILYNIIDRIFEKGWKIKS